MKPPNVSSVILLGEENINKSSFLVQGAAYHAEQGCSVAYLSSSEFDRLPLQIHGFPAPGPDVFSRIRFIYLPRWQDLLQHLFSIHLHANIPNVIVVEGIERYSLSSLENDSNPPTSESSHMALICASLFDAASTCAETLKTQAYLIVTLNRDCFAKIKPVIDIFFTDVVWLIKQSESCSDDSNGEIVLSLLKTGGIPDKQFDLTFVPNTENGALVLRKVFISS